MKDLELWLAGNIIENKMLFRINFFNKLKIVNYLSLFNMPSTRNNSTFKTELEFIQYLEILKSKNIPVYITFNLSNTDLYNKYIDYIKTAILDLTNYNLIEGIVSSDKEIISVLKNITNGKIQVKNSIVPFYFDNYTKFDYKKQISIVKDIADSYILTQEASDLVIKNKVYLDNTLLMLFDDCVYNCKLRNDHHTNKNFKLPETSLCYYGYKLNSSNYNLIHKYLDYKYFKSVLELNYTKFKIPCRASSIDTDTWVIIINKIIDNYKKYIEEVNR